MATNGVHAMSELSPGGRLTDSLIALIAHLTAPLGETRNGVALQAAAATVLRASPTMLDVEVPPEIPEVALTDGPTPSQALVYDGDQLIGELLVWVRDGRLIGLEQAWYTDEPPTAWPDHDRVIVT